MEIYVQSDIGLVRNSNQDSYGFKVYDNGTAWSVVCDGMGGANGGNVASSLTVETVSELMDKYDISLSNDRTVEFLVTAIQTANSKVYEMQKNNDELSGMGTTVELVFVKDNIAHIIHAGDSRVYCMRNNRIQQVTVDHSVVQEMVDNGEITPEEALVHPNKNYITRAVGVNPDINLDYIEVPFEAGDVVLTCTDGLSNYVKIEEILECALNHKGEDLTKTLIEMAKSRGGSDNITVAVIYSL